MKGIQSLIFLAFGISIITVVLFYLDKRILAGKNWSYWKRQILFGIVFGCFAIMGTEFGVSINGAVMNVRDAAPLCAGLFFGPGAGVIAGFIGGIERWLAVYWGAGAYTRLACTLGTIVAGLFGAFLKKYLFEGRIAGPLYSLGIGAIAEVFHMLMLYVTNMNDAVNAHGVMMTCGPIMIPMVAIATALPSFAIIVIEGQHFKLASHEREIAQNIGMGILISVLIALIATTSFQVTLQNRLSLQNANNAISQTLEDVQVSTNVAVEKGENAVSFLQEELKHRHIGNSGYLCATDREGNIVAYTNDIVIEEHGTASKRLERIEDVEEKTAMKVSFDGADYYFGYVTCQDYYIMALYPASESDFSKSVSIYVNGFLEVVVLTVVFLMIYILIRIVVVKNLNKINKDLAAITGGELNTVVDVRSSIEFASLSNDINITVDTLKGYIEQAAAKVDEELRVAKSIQHSALPRVFPDDNRYELYASMLAAKDVGGDFYDFYPVGGDDKVAFLIADVSGKGIPAAMFMMSAKSVIKSIVEQGASPGVAFTKANEKLCADNSAEMFVTAWMGIMDLNTGHVVYANAGHNPPVIKNADGSLEYLKCRPGFVLAGMEGMKYKDYELNLEEGQSIFLYTDGVTEATDLNNELFGEDRLLQAIADSGNMNMRYTCKLVKQHVDKFVGEAPQFDDITMLGIKRKTAEDRKGKLVVECNDESAEAVRNFFDKFCEDNEIPFKAATKIMVMVDEIYSNILNYSGATIAIVTAEYGDGKVIMSYQDNGIYYDPLEKEDPDITLSAEEREIGGLGIFMVKKMAEDVKYTRIAGKNILDVVLNV